MVVVFAFKIFQASYSEEMVDKDNKIDLTNEKIPEEQPETPSAPDSSAPDSPSSAQNTPTSVIANSPKTGDHTPILMFVLLMALSAGGIVTMFVMKKHKK